MHKNLQHKTHFPWLSIFGLLLVQLCGEAIRVTWEQQSPILGVVSDLRFIVADFVLALVVLAISIRIYLQACGDSNFLTNIPVNARINGFASGLIVGSAAKIGVIASLLITCKWLLDVGVVASGFSSIVGTLPMMIDAIYIGFFEEIFFRGVLLLGLCRVMSQKRALFLQSTIFLVFHLHQAQASILFVVVVFISGWALGFVVLRGQSLWPAIGAHIGWNFFTLAILGTPQTENIVPPLFKIIAADPSVLAVAKTYYASFEIAVLLFLALMFKYVTSQATPPLNKS